MITEGQALLLAVLRDHGKAHGHAIGKFARARQGKPMSIASLYQTLHALESAGLVEGRWEGVGKTPLRRPRRRHYTINEAGERALADYIEHIEALPRMLHSQKETGPILQWLASAFYTR